jgi:hypothetical protein
VKPAMALLDANTGLLIEAGKPSPQAVPANLTEQHNSFKNESISSSGHPEQFSFPNSHLSPTEFTSPSQYSFDPAYYSGQHSASTSPATFTSGNLDTQPQEFGYGIGGNAGLWSY